MPLWHILDLPLSTSAISSGVPYSKISLYRKNLAVETPAKSASFGLFQFYKLAFGVSIVTHTSRSSRFPAWFICIGPLADRSRISFTGVAITRVSLN